MVNNKLCDMCEKYDVCKYRDKIEVFEDIESGIDIAMEECLYFLESSDGDEYADR